MDAAQALNLFTVLCAQLADRWGSLVEILVAERRGCYASSTSFWSREYFSLFAVILLFSHHILTDHSSKAEPTPIPF